MLGLVAPPEQLKVIARIQAMMSVLEGHGDVTMDRAGADRPRRRLVSRVLHERRTRAPRPVRLLQQLVGIEAKMRQYQLGETFIRAVEKTGGPAALARVWEGADRLPTMEEIRHPDDWFALDRTGAARRSLMPAPGADELLGRCTFPACRSFARLWRLGRSRFSGSSRPGLCGRRWW